MLNMLLKKVSSTRPTGDLLLISLLMTVIIGVVALAKATMRPHVHM